MDPAKPSCSNSSSTPTFESSVPIEDEDSLTEFFQNGAPQPNLDIPGEETKDSEAVQEASSTDLDSPNESGEEPDVEYDVPQPSTSSDVVPVDITPEQSGGVLKILNTAGAGDEVPGYGDKVTIHYDGYLLMKDSKLLFESDRSTDCTEFSLGRGEVIKGWDLAVSTMKKGESSLYIIQPEYGYGVMGRPPKVPPNTPLLFNIDLYDWQPEDLSPRKDFSILRKVLLQGEGSVFPNEGSKMKIHLLGRYKGSVFEDCDKEFILGEGCCVSIPEGIEIALHKFHLKEKSLIYLKDKYGMDTGIVEFNIPPKSPVTYEVTLLSFEKAKDVWEMNSDEKYEKAKISRERGIEFTMANNFKVALKNFRWIITCLEKEPGVEPQSLQARNALLLSGFLNIALCLLKMENYKDTIHFCNKALQMQPENEKALFRRGQAKMSINDSEEALEDFNTVCQLYPENKAAKQHAIQCQEQIKKQRMKDKSIYNKMFEKFVKQDQERMKNMKTETGVWQNEKGEEDVELHQMSETERLIEQSNSLLRDANIIELSSNVCEKF